MTILKKPVRRVSNSKLSSSHGRDKNRRIVVTLIPGNGGSVSDLIQLRPERLKKSRAIALEDLWVYLIKCEVNQGKMAKLRLKKENKAIAKAERARKRELRKPL